ncbi:MAG: 50S ribosomal protein L11 methyltransferase [Pseudohongiellaceae bacterium]|jgi:ribosomal protein L11 methyltransferase
MWQQLTIRVRSADAEPVEQTLLEHGAVSISYLDAEDQPVFQEEPGSTPLWDNSVLLALFSADTDLAELLDQLKHNPAISNAASLAVEQLEDQAWERAWMADFQPLKVGQRLWICPSWLPPPDPDAVTVLMDPGLAFGSGSHHTTELCLQWLDQADVSHKTVIDYGSGSGILAIAAAKLGATRVSAVDNDPQAILATLDNCQRNGVSLDTVHAYLPDALPEDTEADILIANILAAPLMSLAGLFADLLRPGGQLVLSGLLETQIDQVADCYQDQFDLKSPVIAADWVRLDAVRKA